MALARCACEAARRPGRAGDALCACDGGGLHAQPGEDRDGAPRAGSLLTMANTTRVVMPQLGESVHEGTISRWLVKPGDKVVEFEPLLEVDTDKVSAEVPSPVTGVLREMLASELGVDLSKVHGTGIGGRVTKKDVEQYAASAKAAPAPTPQQTAPTPAPAEGDEVVQLTRVRRLIAENMVRSKTTIPHAWQTQEADMSGVVSNRNANKAAFQKQEGFSLTYLPYVMGAAISALREHREVNSTFNETELIIHRDINLGVSVGLEDTLVVPVIRRADSLSIAGLARSIKDVATRARNKKLSADDLAGGTFTVNNSGTFGTLFSYSVINPGQAGILTMEAIVDRPVAVGGMIGIKPMMYLCFSFDHRVLDGLKAARFLTSCRKWLEAVTPALPVY